MQVDLFIDLLARRYGLEPTEVVDAVRWVQQHRDFVGRLKHGGWIALAGTILSAILLSVWEGIKALARAKT